MMNFSLSRDPYSMSPVGQLFCLGLLRSAKALQGADDASGGKVAKQAAKGILRGTAKPDKRDTLFVVDNRFEWKPNAQGVSKPCVVLELYLDKTWYRLDTRYVVAPAHPGGGAWESYQPVAITTITGRPPLTKVDPKSVPAPIIIIDVGTPAQLPSSALCKTEAKKEEMIYV